MLILSVLYWLLYAISALGALGCLSACAALWQRFRAAPAAPASSAEVSSLSMIVPIKGTDAHTEEHLNALVASQLPADLEYLFAMESSSDPAYAVCARVQGRHPDKDVHLILAGPAAGRMGKQHNLAAAVRQARYSAIGSMDADVLVDPDTLAVGLRALGEPRAGVAYFLPCYWGDGPAGGTLVALYSNYGFASNVGAIALRSNPSFIIGSLWLMTRATLDRIGGLEQFGATVSDDAAIGSAIRKQGLRNVLLPHTVRIPFEPLRLRAGARHVLKWLAMLRAEGLVSYLTIAALWHPIFWSAVTLLVAVPLRGEHPPSLHPSYLAYAAYMLAVAAFARVACAALLNRDVYRITGMPAIKLALLLIPYELLAVPVLFGLGLFRRTIEWRGRRYRLGPHGVIQGVADVAPIADTA
jgi:ceramide glucosyltransferase